MINWADIRYRIGKRLNDPDLVQYGAMIKPAFSAQYRLFVLSAQPEELEIQRLEQVVSFQSGLGSYTIPLSIIFIGITENEDVRLIPVDEQTFRKARSNLNLAPMAGEVLYYKDFNVIRFLSDWNKISKTTLNIIIKYVSDFDFVNGTSMSEVALGTIIENVAIQIMGVKREHS